MHWLPYKWPIHESWRIKWKMITMEMGRKIITRPMRGGHRGARGAAH
uniref:Uncharacterized protein n=1 Tax=Arundo donax TaxID=35708 RepID=A0A0A8Y8I1_ARUDO